MNEIMQKHLNEIDACLFWCDATDEYLKACKSIQDYNGQKGIVEWNGKIIAAFKAKQDCLLHGICSPDYKNSKTCDAFPDCDCDETNPICSQS